MEEPGRIFKDMAIVSCGTLGPELNHLKAAGFLGEAKLFFTTPGLHQDVRELERQLVARIRKAKAAADRVLVVYGGKFCYVNPDEPARTMKTLLMEQGEGIGRIRATHCMDMIAGESDRKAIAEAVAGEGKVWWMTPGWVKFRHQVFKGWDRAVANENFPRHTGGAVVLDGIGFMDAYMNEHPEEFLEYSDWMGIPIQPHPVRLDRFQSLLLEEARALGSL